VICILYAEFPGHIEIDKSRIVEIYNVLTKYVNDMHGVYPLDLSSSTLIKPAIIVTNFHKTYIPGSQWVAVGFFRL